VSLLIRVGGEWHRAEPVSYEKETEFQELVKETFDLVLATQTDAPSVIAREVHTPLGGVVDVVAADVDGVITLCECKLAKNAGARREVLGQVLEYAGGMNELSFHSFRARMNARLDGDLVSLMAAKAGAEFDEREWIALVSERLERGEFRLMVAVNEITDALKQTVQYLNERASFTILAVELRRAKHCDVEAIAPNVFGEEAALKKLPPPAKGTDVENADTVIVAATYAFGDFERTGAYVCQPNRSFREGTEYLGFYAKRRIEPVFPRIVERRLAVPFTNVTADQLEGTDEANDKRVATIIRESIADPDTFRRKEGEAYQVMLLDKDAGFVLPKAIDHPTGAAWLRGQRYTRSDALKSQPGTTEDLAAAGG
jgi:hypothetical protein